MRRRRWQRQPVRRFEMLGKAKATPTVAVVRISFSFMVAPLDLSPWRFVVYHSERAGSRERTFSSDIAYSESPGSALLAENDFVGAHIRPLSCGLRVGLRHRV